MPDRPPDNPDQPSDPARTLNDILAALSRVGEDEPHSPSEEIGNTVHGAVADLSAALDQLFSLVRTERAEHRSRITELEAALSAAHARIRQLEAGEELEIPAPPPNDFGQLREAAERLRRRTEELFREAGPISQDGDDLPADSPAQAPDELVASLVAADSVMPAPPVVVGAPAADGTETAPTDESEDEAAADVVEAPSDVITEAEADAEARIRKAREAVESSMADEHPSATPPPEDEQEEFARPAVLRVFPGTAGPIESSLDVESELAIEDDEHVPEARQAIALEPPAPEPAKPAADEPAMSEPTVDEPTVDEPTVDEPAEPEPEPNREPEPEPTPTSERPEPVEVAPRPARKRRGIMRRRRIDARKLAGVDPATALRAMVSAIDDVWTAGVTIDLVIALTDGGALKVSGGHNRPLSVVAVQSGTPARTTVTATTAQLIPLFGRLELTDEQSPPLIHGPRRDADLLVGWIDRAQRLEAEPL